MNLKLTQDELYTLKRSLYKWAKDNLRGKIVINELSGNLIEISSQGIDEWFSKSKSEEQIKSITLLSEILRLAKFTHNSDNIHSTRKMHQSLNIMNVLLKLTKRDITQ